MSRAAFVRAPHPSSLSSPPLLAPLSFTLRARLLLLRRAVRLPLVPRAPSLHLSNRSAYSVTCASALLVLCVCVSSSSFLPSLASGLQVKPLLLLLSLSSAVISPPASAAVHYSSFSFSVCSSQCASPVTHAQCFHTRMHTHTLCLSVSGSLLMHVACFACPPPISLTLSFSLSHTHTPSLSLSLSLLSLPAAHTAVPLQAASRFL